MSVIPNWHNAYPLECPLADIFRLLILTGRLKDAQSRYFVFLWDCWYTMIKKMNYFWALTGHLDSSSHSPVKDDSCSWLGVDSKSDEQYNWCSKDFQGIAVKEEGLSKIIFLWFYNTSPRYSVSTCGWWYSNVIMSLVVEQGRTGFVTKTI